VVSKSGVKKLRYAVPEIHTLRMVNAHHAPNILNQMEPRLNVLMINVDGDKCWTRRVTVWTVHLSQTQCHLMIKQNVKLISVMKNNISPDLVLA